MTKIKNLRLEWGKLELITCGGWVGESWLAYTHVLPLFYMQVIKLVDPLCYDIKPMTRLVQYVYICVCHIMTFPPLNPSTIDDAIKSFLRCCQNFCHYTSTATIPWWLSCGNLISLLNCPGQIEQYGHIRLYWEGNRERYIMMIKPLLKNMCTTLSFRKLKLAELHTSVGLRELLTKDGLPGGWKPTTARARNYIIYKSQSELETYLNDHFPISAVVDEHENTYSLCKNNSGNIEIFLVQWNESGVYQLGIWCAPISISNMPDLIFSPSEVKDHIIISPVSSPNESLTMYCAMTSNWKVRGEGYLRLWN